MSHLKLKLVKFHDILFSFTSSFTFSFFFFEVFTCLLFFIFFSRNKMSNLTPQLYDKIKYFAKFPQTGVSLRQMVLFGKFTTYATLKSLDTLILNFLIITNKIGQKPSQGTLFKASQFLHGK